MECRQCNSHLTYFYRFDAYKCNICNTFVFYGADNLILVPTYGREGHYNVKLLSGPTHVDHFTKAVELALELGEESKREIEQHLARIS